jgi:hypothetical protein
MMGLVAEVAHDRQVVAEYLAEGHPHLADLARDLPRYRLAAIDVTVADRVTAAAATIDKQQLDDDVAAIRHLLSYAAGWIGSAGRSDVAAGLRAAADVVLDHYQTGLGLGWPTASWAGLADIDDLCDGGNPEREAAIRHLVDRAARIREAAADRRELAVTL